MIKNYTNKQLNKLGLKFGKNVQINSSVLLINPKNIIIKNNVRIDAFTIITAGRSEIVNIGSNIHIGSHVFLSGTNGCIVKDFSGLSSGVKIFTAIDDFHGSSITNPTTRKILKEKQKLSHAKVIIGRHSIIGANTVILPGAIINDGVAIGANSLVKKKLASWTIYAGSPVKKISKRSKECLKYEKFFLTK